MNNDVLTLYSHAGDVLWTIKSAHIVEISDGGEKRLFRIDNSKVITIYGPAIITLTNLLIEK